MWERPAHDLTLTKKKSFIHSTNLNKQQAAVGRALTSKRTDATVEATDLHLISEQEVKQSPRTKVHFGEGGHIMGKKEAKNSRNSSDKSGRKWHLMNVIIVSFPLVFHIINLPECSCISVWALTKSIQTLCCAVTQIAHTHTCAQTHTHIHSHALTQQHTSVISNLRWAW